MIGSSIFKNILAIDRVRLYNNCTSANHDCILSCLQLRTGKKIVERWPYSSLQRTIVNDGKICLEMWSLETTECEHLPACNWKWLGLSGRESRAFEERWRTKDRNYVSLLERSNGRQAAMKTDFCNDF